MNNKKKIFIFVLLIPVIWTTMLTAVGYVYSKDMYIFKGLGGYKEKRGGNWPVIVKTPNIDKSGVIVSYQPAWRYLKHNGYTIVQTWGGLTPKKVNYDDLRNLINKHIQGERKERYLSKIKFYEIGGLIEEINRFIPWEFYSVIGIWLAFLVVFKRKALTAFSIWYWYTIWRYISLFGFYAFWNGKYDLFNFLVAMGSKPLNLYTSSLNLELVELSLLILVPAIHFFKFLSHLIVDDVSSYFSNIENKLGFKQKHPLKSNPGRTY